MICKTEAIVLHSIRYGDSRLIVYMYTREHGRLSFIVSVGKSGRSSMKKQYFQPLTPLAVEADVRPQQQLQRLRGAELLCPSLSLLSEPGKLAIALFIAEFLYYALRGEQQDHRLFDYIRSSLEWLDKRQGRYANFHLVFLMRLSRFLGFFPNLTTPSTLISTFVPQRSATCRRLTTTTSCQRRPATSGRSCGWISPLCTFSDFHVPSVPVC